MKASQNVEEILNPKEFNMISFKMVIMPGASLLGETVMCFATKDKLL